jgi:hypothetical protein
MFIVPLEDIYALCIAGILYLIFRPRVTKWKRVERGDGKAARYERWHPQKGLQIKYRAIDLLTSRRGRQAIEQMSNSAQ